MHDKADKNDYERIADYNSIIVRKKYILSPFSRDRLIRACSPTDGRCRPGNCRPILQVEHMG
jgi:hypothetical protein